MLPADVAGNACGCAHIAQKLHLGFVGRGQIAHGVFSAESDVFVIAELVIGQDVHFTYTELFVGKLRDGDIIEIDIPNRAINVKLSDEELAAREMFPMTRDRVIPKSLKAYANMVSSADKGGVRIID